MANTEKKVKRQRAVITIETKIKDKQNEIDGMLNKVEKLKVELKELQEKKKNTDLQKLNEAIIASGKSIEEILAAIK